MKNGRQYERTFNNNSNFYFYSFFVLNISSCMNRDEELKIEQTKIFLDKGCEQVIIPNTVSSFYWSNCKK